MRNSKPLLSMFADLGIQFSMAVLEQMVANGTTSTTSNGTVHTTTTAVIAIISVEDAHGTSTENQYTGRSSSCRSSIGFGRRRHCENGGGG